MLTVTKDTAAVAPAGLTVDLVPGEVCDLDRHVDSVTLLTGETGSSHCV